MQRWVPDEQLLAAVRAGRCTRTYADMSGPDRAWVVAGLSRMGVTAERIKVLLGCSLRTVRVVKADPAVAVCGAYMDLSDAFTDEVRLLRSELGRMTAERDAVVASAGRLRQHVVRVTAPKNEDGVPVCSNGHALTRYNSYEHGGRVFCRECRRVNQAAYRLRKMAA